jgi:hypothetical protein
MDIHKTTVQGSPISKAPIAGSGVRPGSTNVLPDKAIEIKTEKLAKGPTPPTYNGVTLVEMGALIEPTKGAFHLITKDGAEQFTRVYYHDGKYIIGANGPRLGLSTLWNVKYEGGVNGFMRLTFSTGHIVEIPARSLQISYIVE